MLHSAILLTFIYIPFVINIFVLSIFEWPFYTGFTELITNAQSPFLSMHVKLSSGPRGLSYGLSFSLLTYYVYARSEGSDKTVHFHSLF